MRIIQKTSRNQFRLFCFSRIVCSFVVHEVLYQIILEVYFFQISTISTISNYRVKLVNYIYQNKNKKDKTDFVVCFYEETVVTD
jgi:hypothetical protein